MTEEFSNFCNVMMTMVKTKKRIQNTSLNLKPDKKSSKKFRSLYIESPQITGFIKNLKKPEYMKGKNVLEKYKLIWNKIYQSNIMTKKFDKKSVQDRQYINTKLKCHDGKIKTDFHGKKPPINIIHRFIWMSVDMKKKNERERKDISKQK